MLNFASKPISKYIAFGSVILAILSYLKIINEYKLYFNINLIKNEKQYWRLFSSLFYCGPLSISSIWHVYILFSNCGNIEEGVFIGRPADFILYLLIGAFTCWSIACFTTNVFLGDLFSEYILYYYCRRFPDVNFMVAGLVIPANFIPIVQILFEVLSHSVVSTLIIYFVAHVYFFLHDIINLKYDSNILRLPNFLNRILRPM